MVHDDVYWDNNYMVSEQPRLHSTNHIIDWGVILLMIHPVKQIILRNKVRASWCPLSADCLLVHGGLGSLSCLFPRPYPVYPRLGWSRTSLLQFYVGERKRFPGFSNCLI